MKMETFDLEREQSLWEHVVEINLSESGVHPVSLEELGELGLDLPELQRLPLIYVQTNGSAELREALAELYPGSGPDHIEVTNGTSEANYLVTQVLVEPGDEVVFQIPNYFQVAGVARGLGAEVRTFSLRQERGWEPDWAELEAAVTPRTKLIYLSHPNNPTGRVLGEDEVSRVVEIADRVGAWLLADQVYRGSEHDGTLAPDFWGRYDRVVVTSGLSKAFGIPGARIGWVVGPPELVSACWGQHDYTTISPGALSDRIAQFALRDGVRERLYERGRSFMGTNRVAFESWVESQQGRIVYSRPQAGAYAFVRYDLDLPSAELVEVVRERAGVMLVAGAWTGMESYLRFGLGGEAEPFAEGLRRITALLGALRSGDSAGGRG